MNIGIVTTWFERGASQVSRQYRDLLNKKNNVFIYARGGEKYERNNPIWDTQDVTWGKKAYFQTNGTQLKDRILKIGLIKIKLMFYFLTSSSGGYLLFGLKNGELKLVVILTIIQKTPFLFLKFLIF